MKIRKITLYGIGLIGAGWATHLLIKGIDTITLYDLNEDCINRGLSILNNNMDFLVNERAITKEQKESMLSSLKITTDIKDAISNADLIIENGPEKIEIKQSIIDSIEKYAKDDAIITSSTSGIKISEITANAVHPERIVGCHPYHPVYLLPLLEINKLDVTDNEIFKSMMDFFKSVDKKPVLLKKESDGYIGSHLMNVLLREALNLVMEGICTIDDIDNAFLYGPGMRYGLFGIFEVLQLAGGETGLSGVLNGPIGESSEKWLRSYANWTEWPQEVKCYFREGIQNDMDNALAERDLIHGRTNQEMEKFRDKGLVKLLQIHGLL